MNFFLKSSYKHLDFPEEKSIFPSPLTRYTTQVKAPVAQLDRASDYGSEGREFESSIARQKRLQIAISFLLPIQTSDAMIQT